MFGVQTIVMILLCNDCGCRIDELLNFQLSDFDNNVIILNGHRFILSNRTLDSLSNYINNYRRHIKTSPGFDNFLFINSKGKKIQRVTAILAISKAAHAANVPISFKILRFSSIYREHLNGATLTQLKDMFAYDTTISIQKILIDRITPVPQK